MPLYQYECKNGHRVEHLLPVHERHSVTKCGDCGAECSLRMCPPVTRFKNEKYNTWEPSFERPYAPVDGNPWLDDTDK